MTDRAYFADGDGAYRATHGRNTWIFQVRNGRVFYDYTDLCAIEDFPPRTRRDWAAADYEKVG